MSAWAIGRGRAAASARLASLEAQNRELREGIREVSKFLEVYHDDTPARIAARMLKETLNEANKRAT